MQLGSNKRVVRLLKNELYPTYQLHAILNNKHIEPSAGLCLGALITMEWLVERLGENAPRQLTEMPSPDNYKTCDFNSLPSVHVSCGYVVDIVSLPEQGIWTLQVTEPDLGSDPGNPTQERQPVPGRVIETNVGFKISGGVLECGFQIIVSDPAGTLEQAEVYRLAIIRRLIKHPDFGLRQIITLNEKIIPLDSVEELRKLLAQKKDDRNQLPSIIFTSLRNDDVKPLPSLSALVNQPYAQQSFMKPSSEMLAFIPKTRASTPPPYDVSAFARKVTSFGKVYMLADNLFEKFSSMINQDASPGDIIIMEPNYFGGKIQVLKYRPSKTRQQETLDALLSFVTNYPRGKHMLFGNINFLSAAREGLLRDTKNALKETDKLDQQWTQRLEMLEDKWESELEQYKQENQALKEQLERQRAYQARIEKEKDELRSKQDLETQLYLKKIADRDEDIAYLRRKLSQPRDHTQIVTWVEDYFSDRLALHSKAVDLLSEKSAREIDIGLICDAIDFLATDYWDRLFNRISSEEMLTRCSEKYGRPFEIKPTGNATIEYTPTQYKIKYYIGAKGKPIDSALDYHLGVGNDPENLLRIYFLIDSDLKKIVVGSLPHHLRAVKIKA